MARFGQATRLIRCRGWVLIKLIADGATGNSQMVQALAVCIDLLSAHRVIG